LKRFFMITYITYVYNYTNMTVEIISESNTGITIVYDEELKFQFEILDKNVRFKKADFVIKQNSKYRAGGNSERTYRYKMPHFEGNEENIPLEVINKLKERGHLQDNYPN